jgi:8-amino-7-oxononanoate synthase
MTTSRPISASLQERLTESEDNGTLRRLRSPCGKDFCSNDYLGFAMDPLLRERVIERLNRFPAPLGCGGSRLLRGHSSAFEHLERQLAEFCGTEAALFFPSGYQANIGLFSSVLTEHDTVFSDERNHASIIDGIRLSNAKKAIYPHCDLNSLERKLRDSSTGRKFIVTESIFSMSGLRADLRRLASIAERYSAALIVDEAHATGIHGSGLVNEQKIRGTVIATIHTGGKALGSAGAWVAGSTSLKQYLINFSRPFIFSTAPSPMLLVQLSEALRYWVETGPQRLQQLKIVLEEFRRLVQNPELSYLELTGDGHIFFFEIGDARKAMRASDALAQLGFDVRAIRPPSVPKGRSGLRIVLRATLTVQEVRSFTAALIKAL